MHDTHSEGVVGGNSTEYGVTYADYGVTTADYGVTYVLQKYTKYTDFLQKYIKIIRFPHETQ